MEYAYALGRAVGGFAYRFLFWTSGPSSLRKGLVNGLLLEVYLVASLFLMLR